MSERSDSYITPPPPSGGGPVRGLLGGGAVALFTAGLAAAAAGQGSPACSSSDAALVAEVDAKHAKHLAGRGAGNPLVVRLARVADTLGGTDALTSGDVRAEWPKDPYNPFWTRVLAELDRLEACRNTPADPAPTPTPAPAPTAVPTPVPTAAPQPQQPQDVPEQPQDQPQQPQAQDSPPQDLPPPTVETAGQPLERSQYRVPAGSGSPLALSASHRVGLMTNKRGTIERDRLVFSWESNGAARYCYTLEYLGGKTMYTVTWGASGSKGGVYAGAGPRSIHGPDGGHPTTTHMRPDLNDGAWGGLRTFCQGADTDNDFHIEGHICEAWRFTVWAQGDRANTQTSQVFITEGCPPNWFTKITITEVQSGTISHELSAPATARQHEPNKAPHPAKTGGQSIKISWDYNPPRDPYTSMWWGAPWGCYLWGGGTSGYRFSDWGEAKTWQHMGGRYSLAHHNSVTISGMAPGIYNDFRLDWHRPNRNGEPFTVRMCDPVVAETIFTAIIEVEDLLPGATTPTGTWR